ncbi:MAG: MFS transporter [Comamonadaceae bacterium]|nr:MAG: MFS transporter [Comamonadaceae bacterium]
MWLARRVSCARCDRRERYRSRARLFERALGNGHSGEDDDLAECTELDVPAPVRARSTFAAIRRDRCFWRLLITFFVMSFAFTGLLTHFVPMLRSMDVEPSQAATLASLIGFAVIGSRVMVGFLLDHVRPGLVAGGVCALSAAGTCFLIVGGVAFAPLAAIALGLAIGGEIDMIGFFTARYFALAGYARAYSWMYTGFVIAAGISPLLIGMLFDALGTYSAALILCAALAAMCACAFATLPTPTPRTSPASLIPQPAETKL